MSEVTGG